ncbi:mechanosensitive ion channel family protein [Neolewinella agarilytica]|nr:mechanosensitive ion channel family protein [Neolewinella agarilytica]
MKERSLLSHFIFGILELVLLSAGIYLIHFDPEVFEGAFRTGFWRTLLFFGMAVAVLNLLVRFVKLLYRGRNYGRRRGSKNFIFGVENIRKLSIGLVTVFTVFTLMGIDVKSLITSLSIVAAAIAIISKDFVNDLIVGFYYSFTDVFEVGDYVKFHGYKGKVVDIGLLKIRLLNDNDDVVILPNGRVYADEIVNYTRRDVRMMNVDFEMDIKAISNLDVLEDELRMALAPFAEAIEEESYLLKIMEVKKDFLELKFQFQLKNMDRQLQRETKRKAVREIFSYVAAHGVGKELDGRLPSAD